MRQARLKIVMRIMIRKATPAKKVLPVRNHTTSATMPAGRMKMITLTMRTRMIIPMIKRMIKPSKSKTGGKIGSGMQKTSNCARWLVPKLISVIGVSYLLSNVQA